MAGLCLSLPGLGLSLGVGGLKFSRFVFKFRAWVVLGLVGLCLNLLGLGLGWGVGGLKFGRFVLKFARVRQKLGPVN